MERGSYLEQVLGHLHRVTNREKEAIQQELEGHIEDHMEGLLELGWDEALAEERTLAAMGDPVELARELDRQYPLRWLIIGGIAKALLVLLVSVGILKAGLLIDQVQWNVQAQGERLGCSTVTASAKSPDCRFYDLDIRMEVGNDVVCLYQMAVGEPEEQGIRVVVDAVNFDRSPLGLRSYLLVHQLEYASESMERQGIYRDVLNVYAQPGDRYVAVRYNRNGYDVRAEIPLDWEAMGHEMGT